MTDWKPPVEGTPVRNWPTAFVMAVMIVCITVIVLEVIK